MFVVEIDKMIVSMSVNFHSARRILAVTFKEE